MPEESICPNAIVNPDALFKSLTLSNVGIVAKACKFFNLGCSIKSDPAGPAEVTTGGPLNLTVDPAALWWSSEKTFT